ncbi:MAG: hypothetical protein Q4E69_03385 [Bacilli bacterium]|nr:hypothetical protein [Bacilli bacterium]
MEIKRNVRRKNRKIKFSENQYVENVYFQEDRAVIPVRLDKISDLYMEHDYKQMELSDSVCKYIEEIAYMIPINTDIELEIHCPKVDIETQLRMKRAIKNNYGIEIDDVEYDMNSQNIRSIVLLIFGVILLTINILADKYLNLNSIVSNFLCVVWWVAIWDTIEIQMLDKSENKWKRLNYQQLYDSNITFVFDLEEE